MAGFFVPIENAMEKAPACAAAIHPTAARFLPAGAPHAGRTKKVTGQIWPVTGALAPKRM